MSSNNDDGVDDGVVVVSDDIYVEKQEMKKSSLPQSTIADILRGPTTAYVFYVYFRTSLSNDDKSKSYITVRWS